MDNRNWWNNRDVNCMKMKKIFNILSILLGAVIVFASCHREDIPCNEIENSGYPIAFSTMSADLDVKGETKEQTIARIKNDGFHVWASRTNGGQTDNNVFLSTGSDVTFNETSSSWIYSPVRYWASGDYTFYAVSPTNFVTTGGFGAAGLLNLNFGSDGWDLSTRKTDLMLGKATASGATQLAEANGPTPVTLTFEHMLSMINFTAKNVDPRTPAITVTGVEISGNRYIAKSCTMSSSSSQWEFTDATATWSVGLQNGVALAADQFKAITSDITVFPEQTGSVTVKVTFTTSINGVSLSDTKSATITPAWASGKIYTYQINLTSDHISFAEPTVTDWVGGGAAADEIPF